MSTNNKHKNITGKAMHPCKGVYSTHRWDGPVNVKVDQDLLSRVCLRCGLPYETLYSSRKEELVRRYRNAQKKK